MTENMWKGEGLYRNEETGIFRRFRYPPKRGRWVLVKNIRMWIDKPLIDAARVPIFPEPADD